MCEKYGDWYAASVLSDGSKGAAERLVDTGYSRSQCGEVCAQVLAIGACVLIRACRQQLVVAAVTVVVVDELGGSRRAREEIPGRPHRCRECRWRCDQRVTSEIVGAEARRQCDQGFIGNSTIGQTASRPDRVRSGSDHVVLENEADHLRAAFWIPNGQHGVGRECRNVIEGDILQDRHVAAQDGYQREQTRTVICRAVDVVDSDVVNAVTLTGERRSAEVGRRI